MNKELHNLLNELELLSNEAVFFFDEREKWNSLVSSETKKKIEKIRPTAFYIFNKIPYILFFDLTNLKDLEKEQTIHKQVWSFDQAQLAFVIKNNEIKIYNAFAYEKKIKSLQEIELKKGQSIWEVFSFWKLQSGFTWKWLQDHYKRKKQNERITRVHQKLFDNIKDVREWLKSTDGFSANESNTLILRLIFIRYLIDRGVEMNSEFIQGNSIIDKRISFSGLIEDPEKLNYFFAELDEIFNGVLFKDDITLSQDKANFLGWVFSEKLNPNQQTLFDNTEYYFNIFDFNIIPVELISGIYESLIDPETKNADSAFYTPLFIVEHVLSNTLDKFFETEKNKNRSECKVFDASVGSGIFLVQSFRRMVDREIELTGKSNISKDRLAEISQRNLWGIDINPEALRVACFSIYIAILDFEEPSTIMDKFHFPTLNLFQSDFFEIDPNHELNQVIGKISFDFILGNPPWKKDKTNKHLEWVNSRNIYGKKIKGEIEIAQNFLLRAIEFMTNNTVCSLIVSSPIFYNISSTSKAFKNEFLTSTKISNILDLSPVRRYIFEGKKIEFDINTGEKKTSSISNPALIITFKKTNGNFRDSLIEHTSVKSNLFTKLYKTLVVEKFDRKQILQKHFVDNEWMFKIALYGNTLDYHFLKRLEEYKSKIIDLIDGQTIFKGTGILKGNTNNYTSFLPIIDGKILENKDIKTFYTFKINPELVKEEESYIKSGRIENLYKGNQILIKEQAKEESDLVITYSRDYVFRKGVFGISSENKSLIADIYGHIISDFYTYYIFITSCAWGVSTRPQIRLNEEYLSFPFVESNQKGELVDLVYEFLQPFRTHYAQKFPMGAPQENKYVKEKINQIINQTYQIKGYEEDLIDYVLNVSRYQFQESKLDRILKKVSNNEDTLTAYASVFFTEFETIYSDEYMSLEVYNLDHFIALNFVFSKEKPAERIHYETKEKDEWTVLKKIAHSTTISQISKDLFIQKDIKGFENDSFYIIKPNEYKCWHRALAWYDLAEIKQMIEADELEYLNENPDAI